MLHGRETTKKLSTSFINKGNTQKKSTNKIIKRIFENITRPLHSQYNFKNENSMKRCIL
jgi:nucleoid DNA-binding protein